MRTPLQRKNTQAGLGAGVITLGLLTLFASWGQAASAGTPPLNFFKNYFVTGDYVVGGVGLRGLGDSTGFATGTISIPDAKQPNATSVPAGADIVAAYLYWQTVEKAQSATAGENGFFNGYAISGSQLGNPNAPVSWSAGGCSGSSQGTTTLRTYRADVRPYLNLDANGNALGNGSYAVKLADSGSNGGGAPLTLGATLVLIYRVLSPEVPLNAVVLYDGAFAPGNTTSSMVQPIQGFYGPATSPTAKITQIVGNGQTNKSQEVLFNTTQLPSLYTGLPPFPGFYNGSWDNPTWLIGKYVTTNDTSETSSVVPSGTNKGCVSWSAVIFGTTVQDTDNDGLLDVWENNQGYTDLATGQFVALPGASSSVRDIFVELDYLSNLDLKVLGLPAHSHLPKQAAIDMVGKAFAAQTPPIQLHFDLGPKVYPGDPYVVPNGTGGNAISESALVCTDTAAALCAFPGEPALAWKGGFLFIQSLATLPPPAPPVPLGNFQPGRAPSYHYMLFGHALGLARSFWSTANKAPNATQGTLVSIVNSGSTATVTIQSAAGLLKPGDPVNPGNPAFGDTNLDRVTVMGAIGQPALNGTYHFSTPNSMTDPVSNITTTVFTIVTSGVADGTYNFSDQTQLGLAFAGPISISGLSDVGGGDSSVTFGLWPADDPMNCQADPTQPLGANQVYCNNQVGTVQAQAGTLMHELGHTLALTHGGTFYANAQNNPPSSATYGLNCAPNFLSVMNYLFQVRGFPDGGIDYSGEVLPPLEETSLSELNGLGAPAPHYTRWYAPPNALETMLQTSEGGTYASVHCDGTPIGPNEHPAVRVDGTTFGAPIDWNNDGIVPDGVAPQDVNFNGITGDAAFPGVNDWSNLDLRQIDARENAFGLSSNGGVGFFGGGIGFFGGGVGFFGGGIGFFGGGVGFFGGGIGFFGGGVEQDTDLANSTADSPVGLSAAQVPKGAHSVTLNWAAPGFGQIRKYHVWRAVGSFSTLPAVTANFGLFSKIATLSSGTPPTPTFTDTNVKNKVTYTYFITDANAFGVLSTPSTPATITVTF